MIKNRGSNKGNKYFQPWQNPLFKTNLKKLAKTKFKSRKRKK